MEWLDSVDRRGILGGCVAAGLMGATGLCAQTVNAPKSASSNLKVSITHDGVTYSYPNGPVLSSYYVIFAADGRIVFHLGALGDLNKPVDYARAYSSWAASCED